MWQHREADGDSERDQSERDEAGASNSVLYLPHTCTQNNSVNQPLIELTDPVDQDQSLRLLLPLVAYGCLLFVLHRKPLGIHILPLYLCLFLLKACIRAWHSFKGIIPFEHHLFSYDRGSRRMRLQVGTAGKAWSFCQGSQQRKSQSLTDELCAEKPR